MQNIEQNWGKHTFLLFNENNSIYLPLGNVLYLISLYPHLKIDRQVSF